MVEECAVVGPTCTAVDFKAGIMESAQLVRFMVMSVSPDPRGAVEEVGTVIPRGGLFAVSFPA